MPNFLETKLKGEYGKKSAVPFKVMNAIGAMKGNQETAKGAAMQAKHDADMKADPAPADAPDPKLAAIKAKIASKSKKAAPMEKGARQKLVAEAHPALKAFADKLAGRAPMPPDGGQ